MTQLTLPLSQLKREWLDTNSLVVLSKMTGLEFSADDLHDVLTTPEHHNWFGVLIAQLANKGQIERVGYRASKRQEANGRVVSVWMVR